MAAGLKLPFGLRLSDGRLVGVDSVPNGAACGCVCPGCRGALIARNGGLFKIAHFAHGTDCGAGYETAIHETAKQIIGDLGFVWLPESILGAKRKFAFSGHAIEHRFNRVISDIAVWRKDTRKLAVEIFVTHPVDDQKLRLLREQRLACVEYDLSRLPRTLSYQQLSDMLTQGTVAGRWIYSPRIEEAERRADLLRKQQERAHAAEQKVRENEERERKRRLEQRLCAAAVLKPLWSKQSRQGELQYHAPDCPMELRTDGLQVYANAERDCSVCRFCCKIVRGRHPRGERKVAPPTHVLCAGLVAEIRALWPKNEWRDPCKRALV